MKEVEKKKGTKPKLSEKEKKFIREYLKTEQLVKSYMYAFNCEFEEATKKCVGLIKTSRCQAYLEGYKQAMLSAKDEICTIAELHAIKSRIARQEAVEEVVMLTKDGIKIVTKHATIRDANQAASDLLKIFGDMSSIESIAPVVIVENITKDD